MAEQLYVLYQDDTPIGYAYGEPWVAQALLMDDMRYDTEDEARAAWTRIKEREANDGI